MKPYRVLLFVAAVLIAASCQNDSDFTRGTGTYPGRPSEFDGPIACKDNSYRNVALLKAAYASSNADYNLTAQLVTDGIYSGGMPAPQPSADGLVPEFNSCWMSAGEGREWLYVDFGACAKISRIKLTWLQKPLKVVLESSKDAKEWKPVADLSSADEAEVSAKGRYIRISTDGGRCVLTEMEAWGRGGLSYKPQPAKKADGNKLMLSRGDWRLQRADLVADGGESISKTDFDPQGWLVATVPGTVATSYFNVGAIPDIRFDDDQFQISEAYFIQDFWYRDTFEVPADFASSTLMLNFDGIDWKADVFVNGQAVGRIEGAFIRGRFDISSCLKTGETNALAVLIHHNDHPGRIKEQSLDFHDYNGGILGADNPTFHATIGWDWLPTVRGRDIGIWNDVFISAHEGGVSIDDAYAATDLPLPDTTSAIVTPEISLTNHGSSASAGTVEVGFGPLSFSKEVTLQAGESRIVKLDSRILRNPELWWPKGYGEPNLYDFTVSYFVSGVVSDARSFKAGVREMSYSEDGGILDLYINGRRLVGNGGNWGFPEINLNYRAREYDVAVAYHADMNYTVIRDWVGMTGDEEFYEACDRHGVMVWQDFWLANPVDGPDPYDNEMFLANARDYVLKIRRHPSIAIYVGRNEGYPPETLDKGFRALVDELHPDIHYIPSSADDVVSGHGPYRALPIKQYFTEKNGIDHYHSERGMPDVMNAESMKLMLREENRWPQNRVWGMHDYTLQSAQRAGTFNDMVEKMFGKPESMEQFTEWAQWVNYNGYRAMYESRSLNRKGLLIWMSHPSWPSMVWQTYDYYFEPTAAYFGAKKGCAPIRIQWNPVTCKVEVVNCSAGNLESLAATAQVFGCDGAKLWEQSADLASSEDSTGEVMAIDAATIKDITQAYFIKLRLCKGDKQIADNFYWEDLTGDGDFTSLRSLPKVAVKAVTGKSFADGVWTLKTTLRNDSSTPALMIRLKAVGKRSGERILPVMYEDNYFSLLPGEEKTVVTTVQAEDCKGETPQMALSGFNLR